MARITKSQNSDMNACYSPGMPLPSCAAGVQVHPYIITVGATRYQMNMYMESFFVFLRLLPVLLPIRIIFQSE